MADALAEVTAAHPAIDVRLSHADPLDATAMVMRGDADLAVTYRYGVEELPGAPANVRSDGTSSLRRSPLTSVALLTDHVRLVLPMEHPLAQTAVTSLLPFADERFLVGSELFTGLLQRAAARAGFAPRIMAVADDCASMQALAARGVGLALLPGLELLAVERADVVTIPVPDWPVRHVAVETWPDLLRVPSIEPMVVALQAAAASVADTTLPQGLVSHPIAARPASTATSPHGDGPGDARPDAWRQWYEVTSSTLPRRADARPDRGVLVSDESGSQQVHTVSLGAGSAGGVSSQLTARLGGVVLADIGADGEHVWWFADDNGDERGVWMVEPFDGGVALPASPAIAPGVPAGLAVGTRRAVIGRSDRDGAEVFVVDLDRDRSAEASTRLVYASMQYAVAGPLSHDEELLAISHSEHGNSLKPAIRVLRLDRGGATGVVADLFDGVGLGVWPVAFSPAVDSTDLLVRHERHGRARPLIWNPVTGTERELDPQLPGETTASWYPDGSAILVLHQYRARSELYRVELADGSMTRLPTRRGFIADATGLADGSADYLWSSATAPPVVVNTFDDTPVEVKDEPLRELDVRPPALDDLVVGGGAGDIHVLVARPTDSRGELSGPRPTVFLVHGGPAAHDADSFSAVRNAWTSSGYITVQVNYRGSTGYGADWRNANIGRPGRAELEDIVAIRDALVADGTSDPERIVIAGRSWGGCLALLALGQYPGLWSLGVAIVPVADTAVVYEDMMEQIRASYRVRFGGTPTEVPDAYAAASPLTVVGDVDVPVLLTGGLRDPRCPMRQIERYVSRLVELGKQHELHAFDRGHESRSQAERIDEMAKVLAFTRRHLGPT